MDLELDIASTIQSAKDKLRDSGDKNFGTDAEDLLSLTLNKNWIFIKNSIIECLTRQKHNIPLVNTANAKCLLDVEEYEAFFAYITRRCNGEPIDSIFGYTKFHNLTIPFSKYILTPRQETEILTSIAIDFLYVMQSETTTPKFEMIEYNNNSVFRMKKADELKVLDMCCGSGCIGISIATSKKLKDVSVVLCDISDEALTIAKEVANNAGAKNVQIIKSDLFENISSQFDMIICNPPYIKSEDLENLEKEVRNYDPKIALDGGIDGLKFYRQIVALAPKYLNDGGLLVFEIGLGEGEKVSKMLSADFENILVMKDYCGIERYIIAKKK